MSDNKKKIKDNIQNDKKKVYISPKISTERMDTAILFCLGCNGVSEKFCRKDTFTGTCTAGFYKT